MTFSNLLVVGFGGFIGSILRFITVRALEVKLQSNFPYGTLLVNLLGSLLLGIIYSYTLKKIGYSENLRLFLGAGICGGFTTFSAFALENYLLLPQRTYLSIIYILISIVAGIAAVAAGAAIGKAL
jgi:fluoride exporter